MRVNLTAKLLKISKGFVCYHIPKTQDYFKHRYVKWPTSSTTSLSNQTNKYTPNEVIVIPKKIVSTCFSPSNFVPPLGRPKILLILSGCTFSLAILTCFENNNTCNYNKTTHLKRSPKKLLSISMMKTCKYYNVHHYNLYSQTVFGNVLKSAKCKAKDFVAIQNN